MADDEGVLGNLPNSRLGKRSEKRDSGGRPSKTASRAAARAEEAGKPAAGKPAAKAPRASKPRAKAKPAATAKAAAKAKPGRAAGGAGAPSQRAATGARAQPDAGRRQPADPPRPQPSGDAVTSVVRTAATVAATGVRVAGAVTQEILRRLPRP
jgi:hypothetical protein